MTLDVAEAWTGLVSAVRRMMKGPGRLREGRRVRRMNRVLRAMRLGRAATDGERCPFRKRTYVAAWRHGVAWRRGLELEDVPTYRPRLEAEAEREFLLFRRRRR